MAWTDERIVVLKKLWAEGLTATQIAQRLGDGVTRNSVIGKVHRLGLGGRATPSSPSTAPRRVARARVSAPSVPRQRPTAPARPATSTPAATIEAVQKTLASLAPLKIDDGRAITVLSLKESMCKFPIGDPTDPAFAFCGRRACVGPYCGAHAQVAYQPSIRRR